MRCPHWPRWLMGLVLVLCSSGAAANCPSVEIIQPCKCNMHAEEMQIWCSHSILPELLAGLEGVATHVKRPVDELILEHNVLPSLPGQVFANIKVVRLMLRDNGLMHVAANWLAGLQDTLLEVFIIEPQLLNLPSESFEGLINLEAITLHAKGVTRLPSLASLSRLRYFYSQLPNFHELAPNSFGNLNSLEQLHVFASPKLSRLEAGTLQDLPRLLGVNVSHSGVMWLHPRALTRLPSLVELSLTDNRITDAGAVGRSVRDLPVLAVLHLDGNLIDRLAEMSFVDIPSLKELHLSRNKIIEIHHGAFHRLPALKLLNLNDNLIRHIHPEFFLQPFDSSLQELSMVNNQLDHVLQLESILNALPQLRFLDLSGNRLEEITYGGIRGHLTLERLHLDHNRLKRVVREAFIAMPALRELRLRNNSLSNYLESPLWNLPGLKGLDLSQNEFRRLDRRMLANLPALRRLDLSHNNLLVVDPASFLGTPMLEHVNLSHNVLDSLSPLTFPHLDRLFELDTGYNRLGSVVPGLPRALEYLHMPANHIASLPRPPAPDLLLPALRLLDISGNGLQRLSRECLISMPLLRRLMLGSNALQDLEESVFDGLGRLEQLELSNNRLQTLHPTCFRDLRSLRHLKLQGNQLETLPAGILKEATALRSIDIGHNQLREVAKSTLSANKEVEVFSAPYNALLEFPPAVLELPTLRHLDLSHNRIHQLPAALGRLAHLSELHLSKNKLQTLTEGVLGGLNNLTTLDLESNELQFISPHAVHSLPQLVTLRLAKNRLSTVPSSAFCDLPSLLSADLHENQLTHLASDAFTAVPNLLSLNLSYNQLTAFDRAGIQSLKSLEELDLSFNRVSRLSDPTLPSMESLISLRMDNNRICQIQGSPFSNMSKLRILSLRNNKLRALPESTFQPLRDRITNLNFDGNPLECWCGLVWLQSWLQNTHQLTSGPRCTDGTFLRDYRLARSDEDCRTAKRPDNGCEENISVLGPTQQLSSWYETTHRPSPEESEYFYDEYVVYEENTTLALNSTQYTTTTTSSVEESSSAESTIPPGVLSHYIPGDTPTLYASTRPSTDQPTSTRAPDSAFTFFGVPIPSINLGRFWGGAGRGVDSKGRYPGRVQQFPLSQGGGFTPMFPGAQGGFRPILDPSLNRTNEYTKPSLLDSTKWDPESNSLPHASVSKVVTADSVELRPVDLNHLAKLAGAMSEQRPKPSSESPILTRATTSQPPTTPVPKEAIYQHNRLEPDLTAAAGNNQIETTTGTTSSKLVVSTSPTSLLDADSTSAGTPSPSLQVNLRGGKTGPSSLTGFLAPGGQLPPFKLSGRPTITKVTMTPSLGPGPVPIAEDLQEPMPRQAKSPPEYFYSAPTSDLLNNQTMAWYYKNYNRTNLEPYVGPSDGVQNIQWHVEALGPFVMFATLVNIIL